jgi:hypothetical protein
MKRIEIIIPHRLLADAHGILKEVNVGGMSHYKIEGSGRVKAQPVTSQRGTSQRQPEYIPRTKKKDFNDVVYRAIDQYPRGYEEQVKFMDRRPRFVLDKSIVSRLLAAFGRLYPRLSYEFDKMIVGLAESLRKL